MLLLVLVKGWRPAVLVLLALFTASYIFFGGAWRNFYRRPTVVLLPLPQQLPQETSPDAPVPGARNIFFVETSCAAMDIPLPQDLTRGPEPDGPWLSARTACAVEAAARAHPLRPVYLVHTCPHPRPPARLAQLLQGLTNVRLWFVRLPVLFAGPPLQHLLSEEQLGRSAWPVVHASDAVRLYLLWRYGGTYLDTDVLLIRSLGEMRNFACAEEPHTLNNAVLDFARDETGLEVAAACVRELGDFRPEEWAYNGPALVSRVIAKRCGIKEFTREATPERCGGFHCLPPSAFYPLHWTRWKEYFSEDGADDTMRAVNRSMGIHLWNNMASKKPNVSLSSNAPYAQIARRVCPAVTSAVGDFI